MVREVTLQALHVLLSERQRHIGVGAQQVHSVALEARGRPSRTETRANPR